MPDHFFKINGIRLHLVHHPGEGPAAVVGVHTDH